MASSLHHFIPNCQMTCTNFNRVYYVDVARQEPMISQDQEPLKNKTPLQKYYEQEGLCFDSQCD
jgi:hypothetical protein